MARFVPATACCTLLALFGAAAALSWDEAACVAPATQTINVAGARFTVLSPRLVRMQLPPFSDACTFTVVNRATAATAFARATVGGVLTLKTAALTLRYNASAQSAAPGRSARGFRRGALSVTLSAAGDPTAGTVWRPGDDSGANLLSTMSSFNEVSPAHVLNSTSDPRSGTAVQPGVLSRAGWTLLDDSGSGRFDFSRRFFGGAPTFLPDAPAAPSRGADLYMFGCGRAHAACLKDFTSVAGAIPLPPAATVGVWWSHYETFDVKSIQMEVLSQFVLRELPLNVLQMDVGWCA